MNIKLEFKVERAFGDPLIKIMVDDTMCSFEGKCPDELTFDIPMTIGSHALRITHYGKIDSDQTLDVNNNILVDKHVEISKIWLDNIELKEELWEGEFFPVYNPDYVKDLKAKGIDLSYSIQPNLYLGHNGMWQLWFKYPVASWLIEKRHDKIARQLDPDFQSREDELNKVKLFFDSAPELGW